MKLASTRSLENLRVVLKDKNATGPEVAYWVFSDISLEEWENLTVWSPGTYNGEFVKTYGHYHGTDDLETYRIISGEGILIIQKKFFEGNEWIKNKVAEVIFIKPKIGEDIILSPEWGHAWVNIGMGPLITYDNWRAGHDPSDYAVMEELSGMAYYIVSENGEVKAVPNPNYQDLPEPKWFTATEFKNINNN